jgi:hypothetical protein
MSTRLWIILALAIAFATISAAGRQRAEQRHQDTLNQLRATQAEHAARDAQEERDDRERFVSPYRTPHPLRNTW